MLQWTARTQVTRPWKILQHSVMWIKSFPVLCPSLFSALPRLCPTCSPVWSGQRVKDPRWGTQDRGPIRPLCGEWTPAPFIIPFQLKPSKKWLNNQLQANGAIYPCYGRTLVIGLGMSGQCQMSHSNAKRVRQMTESRRREQSNEKQSKRNAH